MFFHPQIGLVFMSETKFNNLERGEGIPQMSLKTMRQVYDFVVINNKSPKLFPIYDLTATPEHRKALAWIVNNYSEVVGS